MIDIRKTQPPEIPFRGNRIICDRAIIYNAGITGYSIDIECDMNIFCRAVDEIVEKHLTQSIAGEDDKSESIIFKFTHTS